MEKVILFCLCLVAFANQSLAKELSRSEAEHIYREKCEVLGKRYLNIAEDSEARIGKESNFSKIYRDSASRSAMECDGPAINLWSYLDASENGKSISSSDLAAKADLGSGGYDLPLLRVDFYSSFDFRHDGGILDPIADRVLIETIMNANPRIKVSFRKYTLGMSDRYLDSVLKTTYNEESKTIEIAYWRSSVLNPGEGSLKAGFGIFKKRNILDWDWSTLVFDLHENIISILSSVASMESQITD